MELSECACGWRAGINKRMKISFPRYLRDLSNWQTIQFREMFSVPIFFSFSCDLFAFEIISFYFTFFLVCLQNRLVLPWRAEADDSKSQR